MADPEPHSQSAAAHLLQRQLIERELTPRRAARLIAGASLLLTVAGGVAGRLFDHKDFHTLGDALWWALQTVTTVGYGDVVPKQDLGRIIGAILMLNGIGLLTVITAAVTATLVEQARRHRSSPPDVLDKLDRIEAQLAELKADRDGPGSGSA